MPEKCFLDTSVLIYAHDISQGAKHDRAAKLVEHLWTTGEGVLSTQVLQELCINLRRKIARPVSLHDIRRIIEDYLNWEVFVNTPESVLRALEIEAQHKISFWDALIIQAAESSGAAVLYSEDLASDQTDGAVRIVNPFATTA
jgi:predicted nucleic acid-binding protein